MYDDFLPDDDSDVRTLDAGNVHTFDLDKHPRALGANIETDYSRMVEADEKREEFSKTARLSRVQSQFLIPGSLGTAPFIVTTNRIILEQVKSLNLSGNWLILTDRFRHVVAAVQYSDYLQNLDIECNGLSAYVATSTADLASFNNGPYWNPGTVVVPGDSNSAVSAALIYFREIV